MMLSATGLIARTSEDAVERWENRSASGGRAKDDQIVSMFRTSTRSSYGLVTSAGRLVLAHVVRIAEGFRGWAAQCHGWCEGRGTAGHDGEHRSDPRRTGDCCD